MFRKGALGGSGLKDWLVTRISAVIIASYIICIFSFLISRHVTYDAWKNFITNPHMRIFGCIAILGMMVHAWIGIWQVLTDYVKSALFRQFLKIMVITISVITYIYTTGFLW